MELFPSLEEFIESKESPSKMMDVLHNLIQPKQLGIILKYTHDFYGDFNPNGVRFRPSHAHDGYYWLQVTISETSDGARIKISASIPTWRKIAYSTIMITTFIASISACVFAASTKDLHFALYPLIVTLILWSGKRSDFYRCKYAMHAIRENLLNQLSTHAT